jgi:glucose-1-phosphate cytidylyltransferase
MKVIILAGGLGTRLREETDFKPKPMVEIGGKPILWHIMKNFAHFGITDFIVASGYKNEYIKDYFLNYESRQQDFTVQLGHPGEAIFHGSKNSEDWTVTIADTGELSLTGERVRVASKYLNPGETFMVAYGDGLADIDIHKLIEFHNQEDAIATLASVQPISRFGVLELNDKSEVVDFREKPVSSNWINIGFFVFGYEVLDYLDDGPLEIVPLKTLSEQKQLRAYKHSGFWQPMDTIREVELLNSIWESGTVPWRVDK